MRTISPWDITQLVSNAIKTGKSRVEIGYFASARVITAITVGKEHNHLPPGHYVLVDHQTEGEQLAISIKVVPVHAPYEENHTVTVKFVGHTLAVNDSVPCLVFQLEGKSGPAATRPSLSWAEQDASNS